MALLSNFLVLLCLNGLSTRIYADSFFPELPIPVFIWGGSDFFIAKNVEYSETITTKKVAEFLISLGDSKSIQTNPLSRFRASNEVAPELIILWLENTDSGPHSYHHLEPLIESAGSSLTILNNYRQNGAGINESVARIVKQTVSGQDLLRYLEENNEICRNGKPEFLIVGNIYKQTINERGVLMRAADTKVKELSSGNYVWISTAETPAAPVMQRLASVQSQVNLMEHDMFQYAQSKYWPNSVWEGLLVSALLILLLLLGVGCTASVQTPTRWELLDHPRCQFTELNEP